MLFPRDCTSLPSGFLLFDGRRVGIVIVIVMVVDVVVSGEDAKLRLFAISAVFGVLDELLDINKTRVRRKTLEK